MDMKGSAQTTTVDRFVLVGTYKVGQFKKWKGFYNYPISEKDQIDTSISKKIKELWLFNGTKSPKYYSAEFIGVMSREKLISDFGYLGLGTPHAKKYLLFKIVLCKRTQSFKGTKIIVRLKDFVARSPKIASELKSFLESTQRSKNENTIYLPKIITQLPPEIMCVRESAIQLDFLKELSFSRSPESPIFYFKNLKKTDLYKELGLDTEFTSKFTHIDCFSGVGGFCTGLHAAGFSTRVAIEKIKSCVDTYSANHPEVHVINKDICKVTSDMILPFCPQDGIDLVTSGMPCETFSTAGNTSRSFYDDRQFLFRQGIRIAKITNAKFLLFENVPAITTKTTSRGSKTLIIDVLKEELVKAGYKNYIEVILDSTKFGVPQKRKRYFLLGTRLDRIRLRKPTSNFTGKITVGDAFIDLPSVKANTWEAGETYINRSNLYTQLMRNNAFWKRTNSFANKLTYQMPMKHRAATIERFQLLNPGEGLKELFEKFVGEERESLQARHVLPKKMFIKRNYRLPLNQPSPTVTSHCLDEFVHPTENRALTVRECARLQSFPDSYDFVGGPYVVPHIDREVQDKYEQIGDAVPPLLAFAWGRALFDMLKDLSK